MHERRQRDPVDLPRLFRQERPRGRAVVAAGAAQRPDPDVHQCRHGAVQERLHRPREAPLSARGRPRRNACAPAASTTTSTMSATPRAITPSSRCSATSPSATTSRTARSSSPGTWSPRSSACRRTGCSSPSIIDDDEAFDLWKKIAGLPESRIIRIAGSDNFWAMGDTGPCGPCSEIFYDHGDHIPGGPPGSPDEDGDRFIEIWNLVFMQFEQLAGRQARRPAASPRSTPAWGSSASPRCCRARTTITRSTCSRALIRAVADADRRRCRTARRRPAHRVIADHLRASSFLIADGVLPSNEGRGYVLRRIMRRAMRHAELLGAREPLMWRLVPALVREMGQAYPELVRAEALITETLQARGNALPQDAGARPRHPRRGEPRASTRGDRLKGETAFTLYDTYGFPLDLTQDALRAARHRASISTASTPRWSASARRRAPPGPARARRRPRRVWFASAREGRRDRVPRLRDRERRGRGRRAGARRQARSTTLKPGESGAVVLNQTPFYGESGGQVGDTGTMTRATACASASPTRRRRPATCSCISARSRRARCKVGDPRSRSTSTTPAARAIRANHSATHLLHEALRQVLGDHVAQKGSLVAPDRLRFDFSHPKPMTRRGARAGRGHRQRHRAAERRRSPPA